MILWLVKRLVCLIKDHRWASMLIVDAKNWQSRTCMRCGHPGQICQNGKLL